MWAVFLKSFRDSRRTVLWMSIGLGLYVLLVMSFYPSIVEQQATFDEMMSSEYYENMMKMFAGSDATNISVADPGVYLNSQLMVWAVLILGAMVMIQAFNAVTNPERNGTMDVLMSFPVTRREMLMARFANTALSLFLVLTVCFLTLVVSMEIWPEFDVPLGNLAAALYGAFFILIAQAAFTYFLVSIVPSSKRWAGAIAYTVFFGGYLIYGLSTLNDTLENLQPFFLFDYYNLVDILENGLNMGHVALMLALTMIFAGLAWWSIDRKELGV